MSASLVGSEMCIRDRLCDPWSSKVGPWGAEEIGRTGQVGPAEPGGPDGPCLLYTSDAADDM
eukprot:6307942-Alexandrium_andersonii.AAC.1